jgi:serine-type D-Ala-D-Ala carboxypeptidase
MPRHTRPRQIIEEALDARVFPAAAVEVGSGRGALWSEAFGALSFDAASPAATPDTLFDLASLTKVIVTSSLVMDLVARRDLTLDERVGDAFPEWRGKGREDTTVLDLLEHASGLPARLVDAPPAVRREFEHDICTIALEYERRALSIYSDLDFILLGFLIADRGAAPLDAQFAAMATDLGLVGLTYEVDRTRRKETASTTPLRDDARRGRRLNGEVHDSYAAALGGTAGHAGLFGTASGVGAFARVILKALRGGVGRTSRWPVELVERFVNRSTVPGSSRALGWDTMLRTSSCGSSMSERAIGHTGFTGTSLWIDPERDRYFVLLTNRVCDGGTREQMQDVRRAFHDSAAAI